MPASIDREELTDLMRRGAVLLVEALGADYFADGHLPGAVNLPGTADDSSVEAVTIAARGPIVVYGSRGDAAAHELARRIEGFATVDVRVYEAGKEDWAEAGLAFERPPPG